MKRSPRWEFEILRTKHLIFDVKTTLCGRNISAFKILSLKRQIGMLTYLSIIPINFWRLIRDGPLSVFWTSRQLGGNIWNVLFLAWLVLFQWFLLRGQRSAVEKDGGPACFRCRYCERWQWNWEHWCQFENTGLELQSHSWRSSFGLIILPHRWPSYDVRHQYPASWWFPKSRQLDQGVV